MATTAAAAPRRTPFGLRGRNLVTVARGCGAPSSTTLPALASRAESSSDSNDISGSSAAAGRSRATRATPRYSSTWTGEARIQSANARRSAASSAAARWIANHSPACWAIVARTCSSLVFIRSPKAGHAAPAVPKRLADVFLHHVRRDSQPLGDFGVAEVVPVLEHDRRTAFRRQLAQHL